MKLEYHPSTTTELNEAAAHYEERRAGLGADFRKEVYAAIQRILSAPKLYAVMEGEIRRCLVRRFPYAVLFRIMDEETIRVLVIRHRRHPRLGLGRQ